LLARYGQTWRFVTAPLRQNAKGTGGAALTQCNAFKTVQAQLWRIRHAVWQINTLPVSGTGPVCVNLLIFSDSGRIYPWQSKTRFTPDFPLNCNEIFHIISEKSIFVISLCQDRGQTMANNTDSAKVVTNRAPTLIVDSPLAAPFAPRQKGQLFEQRYISFGFQQRAM
jgi:hypothetical protein